MVEPTLFKALFGATALVLTFVLFVPYVRSIHKERTVPHVFSWKIWAFGTFVVCFAQLAGGAGIGALPVGFSACLTGYVAFLAYRRRAQTSITTADWVFFLLALLALPAWGATSDPLWAVVLLTTADLVGFGPTLRRAYSHPHQEHAGFFAFAFFRNIFVILALEHYSWTTVLFPAVVGIACLVVAIVLLFRRAAINSSPKPSCSETTQ
jgi:hypothetical protein